MAVDERGIQEIETAVKARFAALASNPASENRFPCGPESAKKLGYPPSEIDALPAEVTESFGGVGYPFAMGFPVPGSVVLDLGCGAGLDAILAARAVNPGGSVVGVDMTAEMVQKAQRNAESLGISHLRFVIGQADRLPLDDTSIDFVITNGLVNLCADKPSVVREIRRVLRIGGRLQMADIFLDADVSPARLAGVGTWSD